MLEWYRLREQAERKLIESAAAIFTRAHLEQEPMFDRKFRRAAFTSLAMPAQE